MKADLSGVRVKCSAFILVAAWICAPLTAGANTDKASLRTQQTALFQQVFAEPDNLDLMFAYARISAQLEDFEAAISTLERALTYNRDAQDVRLELGSLYFNIGSYQPAKAYFDTALASGGLSPAQRVRASQYLSEIEGRTARSRFSGEGVIGGVLSSNASIGPDDAIILNAGTPVTGTDGQGDAGVFGDLRVRHEYDLNDHNTDLWRTDARANVTEFFDENGGDLFSVGLRTGPLLSLTPEQYGPKIRPYAEGDHVHFGNRSLYTTLGAGVEYVNTLSDTWAVFGDAGIAHRFFASEFDDEEGVITKLGLGATYKPLRDLALRGRIDLRGDHAEEDFNSNIYAGLRVEAAWKYDPGFALADRKWEITGTASLGFADYDDPEPAIDPARTREDTIATIGLTHDFHLQDGFFIRAQGNAIWRDSTIPNYDLTIYEARLGVGLDF